ncbi:MAG: serine hydrolase [Prevotellaceae bacterium]|jgi:CubicO group peptidase (beta-lactamase class C family)|nr:serine hydrolase [Prevotellaceae bacterium]
MKNIRIYIFSLFTILSLSLVAQTVNQEEVLKNIESYTHQIIKEWQIPGMALSIVKDDQIIYAKGFGQKEMGIDIPVDEHTSFQIGSVSKSFTALLMAMLVDEEKVGWDDPVKKHLPDFEMYDPWVSDNLLIKDIMIHRTGLPGQSGTYIPCLGYDQEDVYKMFRLIKPSTSLRTGYDYNNITFIIAAKIIEKYMGKPWEECVTERIFIPLEMQNSSLNEKGFTSATNVSIPHSFDYENGAMAVKALHGAEDQALYWLTVIGPAGGVVSSVVDMTQWIRFHLSDGTFNGKQILSEKNLNYLHRGQLITSQYPNRITTYGHCWFIEQNNRYKVFFHTGTTWGYAALCVYVPELNLGMMFLANSEIPATPRYAFMRRLIDLFLGAPDKDYSGEALADWLKSEQADVEKADAKKAETVKTDPAPYNAYTGTYQKERLGDALITLEQNELYITVGPKNWKASLKHINGHDFSFYMGGHTFSIHFEMGDDGNAASIDIDMGQDEHFGAWERI